MSQPGSKDEAAARTEDKAEARTEDRAEAEARADAEAISEAEARTKAEDDLKKIIDAKFNEYDQVFLVKLAVFGQSLLEFVAKSRLYVPDEVMCAFQDNIDLHELIILNKDNLISNVKIITIGRFILLIASCFKGQIKEKLENDFPKFLGYRANLWRYLLDMVSSYMREVNADFTTQFLVANACVLEMIAHCYDTKQYHITRHDSRLWVGVVLHYFGERLNSAERNAVLEMNSRLIDEIELALNGPRRPGTSSQKKSKLVVPSNKK